MMRYRSLGAIPKTVLYALLCMGIAFFAIGAYFASNVWYLVLAGIETDGIVVDVRIDGTAESANATYAPIITYGCGGREITQEYWISSSVPYVPGQHVRLSCLPSDPERFVLDGFIDRAFGFFPMVPSVALLVFVAYAFAKRRRAVRSALVAPPTLSR